MPQTLVKSTMFLISKDTSPFKFINSNKETKKIWIKSSYNWSEEEEGWMGCIRILIFLVQRIVFLSSSCFLNWTSSSPALTLATIILQPASNVIIRKNWLVSAGRQGWEGNWVIQNTALGLLINYVWCQVWKPGSIDRSIPSCCWLINCSEEINTQTDSVYRMAGMQIGTVRKWCFWVTVEDISIVD